MATLVETPDAVLEGLRASPDYTKIEFGGEEREVNFCMYAFDKAREIGHDPVTEESRFADMLFAGMLPFPTAMTYEEVAVWLSVREIRRIRKELGDLLPKAWQPPEDPEQDGGASGKGEGAKKSP